MPIKSYLNKLFVVDDPEARMRQSANLLKYVLYERGNILPVGKQIGDPKIIPQGTNVRITNAKSINSKLTFVFVESTGNDTLTIGWTSAHNLAGKFLNETIGQLLPADDNRIYERSPSTNR